MSDKSSIEWTDATWNPIRGTKGRHHCVRISEGCKHCYAAAMNHRFKGPNYVKGADTPRLDEEALLQPLKWKAPRRIFVCSMTDLFMDEHSDEMISAVFAVMGMATQHTFQVLTKRSKRMREFCSKLGRHHEYDIVSLAAKKLRPFGPGFFWKLGKDGWSLPNVWLGVSAENQERADERIPDLLATPAAVRFVSAEPLLGPIRLDRLHEDELGTDYDALSGTYNEEPGGTHLDWVIVGGESGHGARPCDVSWVRSIKDQCQAAGVPVFVKQLGAKPRAHQRNGTGGWLSLKDKKGGDMAEWPDDLRVRQFPETRS